MTKLEFGSMKAKKGVGGTDTQDSITVPEIPGPIAWFNQPMKTKTWKQRFERKIKTFYLNNQQIRKSEEGRRAIEALAESRVDCRVEKREKTKDPPLSIK